MFGKIMNLGELWKHLEVGEPGGTWPGAPLWAIDVASPLVIDYMIENIQHILYYMEYIIYICICIYIIFWFYIIAKILACFLRKYAFVQES